MSPTKSQYVGWSWFSQQQHWGPEASGTINTFKVLEEYDAQLKVLYTAKLSVKREDNTNTFSDIKGLRVLTSHVSSLKQLEGAQPFTTRPKFCCSWPVSISLVLESIGPSEKSFFCQFTTILRE